MAHLNMIERKSHQRRSIQQYNFNKTCYLALQSKCENKHAEIPKTLLEKFPNHNITKEYKDKKIIWKVQSKCGSACDDYGSFYDSNGNFLRANIWLPIKNSE